MPSAEFLEQCCPWLLPALFMHDDNDELKWIAEVIQTGLFAGGVCFLALYGFIYFPRGDPITYLIVTNQDLVLL